MEERTEKQLEKLVSNLCKGMSYGLICHVDGYNGLYVLNGLKCEQQIKFSQKILFVNLKIKWTGKIFHISKNYPKTL